MTHSSRASLSLSQSLSPGAQKPWIFDNTYIVLYGGLSQSMSGSCLVFIDFHALDSAIFKVWGDGRERHSKLCLRYEVIVWKSAVTIHGVSGLTQYRNPTSTSLSSSYNAHMWFFSVIVQKFKSYYRYIFQFHCFRFNPVS